MLSLVFSLSLSPPSIPLPPSPPSSFPLSPSIFFDNNTYIYNTGKFLSAIFAYETTYTLLCMWFIHFSHSPLPQGHNY